MRRSLREPFGAMRVARGLERTWMYGCLKSTISPEQSWQNICELTNAVVLALAEVSRQSTIILSRHQSRGLTLLHILEVGK
jgi:hypothetical protein